MSKRTEHIAWAKSAFKINSILYFARKKDYLSEVKSRAPGAFVCKWYKSEGWGFIGW